MMEEYPMSTEDERNIDGIDFSSKVDTINFDDENVDILEEQIDDFDETTYFETENDVFNLSMDSKFISDYNVKVEEIINGIEGHVKNAILMQKINGTSELINEKIEEFQTIIDRLIESIPNFKIFEDPIEYLRILSYKASARVEDLKNDKGNTGISEKIRSNKKALMIELEKLDKEFNHQKSLKEQYLVKLKRLLVNKTSLLERNRERLEAKFDEAQDIVIKRKIKEKNIRFLSTMDVDTLKIMAKLLKIQVSDSIIKQKLVKSLSEYDPREFPTIIKIMYINESKSKLMKGNGF